LGGRCRRERLLLVVVEPAPVVASLITTAAVEVASRPEVSVPEATTTKAASSSSSSTTPPASSASKSPLLKTALVVPSLTEASTSTMEVIGESFFFKGLIFLFEGGPWWRRGNIPERTKIEAVVTGRSNAEGIGDPEDFTTKAEGVVFDFLFLFKIVLLVDRIVTLLIVAESIATDDNRIVALAVLLGLLILEGIRTDDGFVEFGVFFLLLLGRIIREIELRVFFFNLFILLFRLFWFFLPLFLLLGDRSSNSSCKAHLLIRAVLIDGVTEAKSDVLHFLN
jgi:hypothetical protein